MVSNLIFTFALVLAWILPGSALGLVLTFVAAFALRALLEIRGARGFLLFWCAGILVHLLGFYWLFDTIARIGEFGALIGGGLFLLFACISALQFPLVLLIFRMLPLSLEKFGMRTAFAWCAVEFLLPRIFPWVFGHGAIALSSLVQIAESLGAGAVSFFILWLAEALWLMNRRGGLTLGLSTAPLGFAFCLALGVVKLSNLSAELQSRAVLSFPVRVVQANISLEDKHNPALSSRNIARHRMLSEAPPGTLVIWPETAVHNWIPKSTERFSEGSPLHPRQTDTLLLFGTLAQDDLGNFFNSAMGVGRRGEVLGMYDKRILMPYGEFTPLGDTFPIFREMNRGMVDFAVGSSRRTIDFPIPLRGGGSHSVAVAPLICYEDVVPGPAVRSVAEEGAALLVNLTNDAWFGDSAAPHQHHLIARFRAIETRRYLIRASNTGLSAIVHPSGASLGDLPTYSAGAIDDHVVPLVRKTLFVRHGEALWWIFELFTLALLLYARLKRRRWIE